MKKNIFIPIITSAIVIPSAVSCNTQDNSCKTILHNYRKYVYNNTNVDDYIVKPANKIKDELESKVIDGVETYYFKDIDYTKDWSRSSWPAAGHLSRAVRIALVAEYRDSDEVREIAKKLTYHWVFSNYHNINWWQNELGANSNLANLGLFTFDYLGKKGQAAFNGKIRESSLKWRPSVLTHTGANVFDYIDITCRNAAINNDKEEMDIAFNRLAEEITNNKIEGFQEDGSFFQHGRQVQNVSYGKSIIRVARTLYQFKNTSYHLADEKMKILSDYVSKGLAGSIFKGYSNYTTVSREFSRINNLDTQANGFIDLCYFIGVDNYPSKDETYNFVESLYSRKNAISTPTVFYFPVAKMIVANIGQNVDNGKEGIYISYKATEPNITNTECVNGENQLGLNLSFGTNTCVMDKGTEYYNIAPIMNYNQMPGTTSINYFQEEHSSYPWRDPDSQIKVYANDIYGDSLYGSKVPTEYVEGTDTVQCIYNDGQDSGVTFSMTKTRHHDRSKYTVTCFTTTDGMVLVGSDFGYSKKESDPEITSTDMYTTVDQYITSDEALETETGQSIRNYKETGNVKYTSLVDNIYLSKRVESRDYDGTDWKRNNRDLVTTDTGSKNVATITFVDSTSKQSINTTAYAYAIEPYSKEDSKFKLATNSNGIHAIELPDNKIAAAFYNENVKSFEYSGKTYTLSKEFTPGKGAFEIFEK